MGRHIIKCFIYLFLSLFVSLPVSGSDYRDVYLFLKEISGTMEWNPVSGSGRIIKEHSTITFKTGSSFMIGGYEEILIVVPLLKEEKSLLIHSSTEKLVRDFFTREEEKRKLLKHVAVIILDPGHGGKDPGTNKKYTTKAGEVYVKEKDVVLDMGIRLEKTLKKRYPDKTILLTRSDDRFLKLEERVEIANSVNINKDDAILFISIHANGSLNNNSSGFEVWHLPTTYRRTVLEDGDIDSSEKDIIPILNNMLEEEYLIESIRLAENIVKQLDKEVGTLTINRGVKAESWFVVRKANMPSVLIELGFVSNQEEALRLKDESYLNKLSKGIYNGITDFITTFESTKGFTE